MLARHRHVACCACVGQYNASAIGQFLRLRLATHSLQERNRRALELLLQKDATIRSLQQQLQQCSGDTGPVAAAAGHLSRAEAAEAALQQAQQQHAHDLVSDNRHSKAHALLHSTPCACQPG